jgi:hypothetical protein
VNFEVNELVRSKFHVAGPSEIASGVRPPKTCADRDIGVRLEAACWAVSLAAVTLPAIAVDDRAVVANSALPI